MQLKSFFESYEKAMTSADALAISTHFAEQFMMSSPTSTEVIKTDVAFLEQAVAFYKLIGVAHVKMKSYEETDLGASHFLVKITWSYIKEDGTELIDFDVTYIVRIEDNPKIIFFIAHNERERLQEKTLQ